MKGSNSKFSSTNFLHHQVLKLKIMVAKILNHRLIGKILSYLFKDNIPMEKFRFNLSSPLISNNAKASIFWRTYESAEIRFVKKYIKGDRDVIEVGSSLGVVSAFIVDNIKFNNRFYGIEANPFLIKTIESNIMNVNPKVTKKIFNKCVNYDGEKVLFKVEKNTLVSKVNNKDGELIESTTIEDILVAEKIDAYDLVCDIEGSELDLILNIDDVALGRCKTVIIELHNTIFHNERFSQNQILNLWLNRGFALIDQYGSVYVLKNKNNDE